MNLKISKKFILLFSILFILFTSCQRDEYNIPDLKGPSTVDFYANMDIAQTVIPAGQSTKVKVKVYSDNGPIQGASVAFYLTNQEGTSYSLNGDISPNNGVTDSNGIIETTLYAPSVVWGVVFIRVVALVNGDPYSYSNRTLYLAQEVAFSE